MAVVVSHAMRRFASSPDANYSSCGLRSEASAQRTSWSSQESESALSRSMRYADPWLYESVRAPNGLLLAPALVLCSCPDYINGTKRSSKKVPSTCKKCKGTRIPLSSGDKFGTMRCYPTAAALAPAPNRAGTVRITSSSRPSILPTTADPYDLMRRSRMTVAEKTNALSGTSQFRARSISPGKAKSGEARSSSAIRPTNHNNGKIKYSTVGRKSILECSVNPYELISTGPDADTSITLVNGQRIRVRPPINIEPDYEDVQLKTPMPKSQIPVAKFPKLIKSKSQSANVIKNNNGPVLKSNEKETAECNTNNVNNSNSNRFKSILKKPTTTFSDTDSSYGPERRSPSPALRSGSSSHFYLPMPSTPRKKVQFLVESEPPSVTIHHLKQQQQETDSSDDHYDSPIDADADDEYEKEHQSDYEMTSIAQKSSVDVEETSNQNNPSDDKATSTTPTTCRLRRSESERALKEQTGNKVIFHDSMALRSPQARMDARIVFTDEDLERLDGITNAKLNKRPVEPPPHPPVDVVDETPPSAPPRKRSNHKQPTSTKNKAKTTASTTSISTFFAPTANDDERKEINVSDHHHHQAQSSSEKVSVNESPNKTILKINNENVHKVKIKNEFSDDTDVHCMNINTIAVSDSTLGKTSIMINGDDCYSTIKVCDEIPLYHSSVIVKDTGGIVSGAIQPEKSRSSSSVYITGNFVNTSFDNDNNKVFENNNYQEAEPDAKESSSSSSPSPSLPPPPPPQSNVMMMNNNKDQQEITTKEPLIDNETTNSKYDGSNLLKCLSNPVEAVRMNLVPHVCGRGDPPRRSRNSAGKGESLPELQTLSEEDKIAKFIEESFIKLRNNKILDVEDKDSEHSSSTQYELMDHGSDCYTDHSNRSSITEEELNARTKFYELLADSAIVEVSESEDHHYESIKVNADPIYEEIEIPPPLPPNPPPSNLLDELQLDKEYTTRSIFEGASKYDILSYLVDAKERGIVPEDSYTYNFDNANVIIEEESKDAADLPYNRVSHLSTVSDSSEDSSLVMSCSLTDDGKVQRSAEVERNDSGVGSETSKSSLSKYRTKPDVINVTCEDCEASLDAQSQCEHEPLICRKCMKKRSERKEIITEIVETEEKYSRDLQIILEEFYQPMLVAGLLTSEQLSAIFLNVEELLENSQALAERLRDAVEIAIEQGDEDLQTVNIGKLILEAAPMLHAFETYCVRQGAASLLLAGLEKEKELLRIFLRVSQMENAVLRRMNLNSFLMVPVQRVTKYPLLLARLFKVTPLHFANRDQLKEAQHKIELHLNHMNSETKDVPSKLWRRISSIPGRRSSSEMDLVNIKLRKIAVDVLEWNHDEAKFALEGRLLFTQPTDNNWRKGRTIKLTPVNALLVTNGKTTPTRTSDANDESLVFSRHSGIRDAALLLVRDKNGRYTLLREPLYLDRCIIAADPAWQSYFEVQELLGKDTFIFKAEDEEQTKLWYRQLQYYAQGMGAWRKRRNALANIMINGMGLRS